MEPLFKKGDHVQVVKFGHLSSYTKEFYNDFLPNTPIYSQSETHVLVDHNPKLVGQYRRIEGIGQTGGYKLSGINGKCAWYTDKQLILVNVKPIRKTRINHA